MIAPMVPHPAKIGALSCLAALAMLAIVLLIDKAVNVSAQQQEMNSDITLHSDNGAPRGIWSDDTTMWVADFSDRKIYAYTLDGGARQDTKDIDLRSANVRPYGLWSDERTIWALNTRDDRIYAYTLSDGNRDESKEIRLDSSNDVPAGIWSDGTTMWVVDQNEKKLFAYALDGGARQSEEDVALSIDRPRPLGVWSDETTFWIAYDYHQDYVDDGDFRLYAFSFDGGAQDSDRDIAILSDQNSRSTGIWSDGTTVWVSDTFHDKLFAYDLPRRAISSDASLSSLNLSVGALSPSFATSTTSYTATVGYEVMEATLMATTSHGSAMVEFLDVGDNALADANPDSDGHQVTLAVGENVIEIEVTAEDDTAMQTYAVTITRQKAEVSIFSDTSEVTEGSKAVFTVARDKAVPEPLDVIVSIAESEALIADSEEGVRTVTIPTGATSTTLNLITDTDDDVWEPHSRVTATIAAGETYIIKPTATSAETRVRDDDFPAATATLSVLPNSVTEGDTVAAIITVTTDASHQPHGNGGTLTLGLESGTAQASDYGNLNHTSFPVVPTDFSIASIGGFDRYRAEYSASIATLEDGEVEFGESFRIAILKASGSSDSLTLSQPTSETVDITDNDAALGALELSGITLSPEFSSEIYEYAAEVEYTVSETSVIASPSHMDTSAPTVKLNGMLAPEGTVPLVVGANEITVEVAAEDATTVKVYTIIVTRAKPTVSIRATVADVYEGHDAVFNVSRDAAMSEPLDVTVSIAETGALVPEANEGSKVVTILSGATSTSLVVSPDTDDDMWEAHSTVTATISNDEAYAIALHAGSASTQVKDNDFPPATASLLVAPNPVAEGGTVTATVMVTTDAYHQPHGTGGTLTLSADDGTAQASDYGRFGRTSFQVFPADFSTVTINGDARFQATYTAAIVITDDSDTETDESFGVTLAKTATSQIALPTPATTTVTISANDSSNDPTLSALSIAPGTLSPAFASGTTSYTAIVGYAHEQITVFAAQNAGNSQISYIDGSDSDIADADDATDGHQVNLAIGDNIVNVKVTAADQMAMQVYNITVARALPEVSISAGSTEVAEGENLIFTLTRDAAASEALDVRVNVDEVGTLISDIEEGDRTVTIPAGASFATFTVTTDSNDYSWEPHSGVRATIANDDAYTVRPGEGYVETHVKDDDFPSAVATLSVNPITVAEGEIVSATITVTTHGEQQPHGGGGTLTLTPVGGTAQDADYGSLSQTTFPIGASDFTLTDMGGGMIQFRSLYTATIIIADDSESESDETILLELAKNTDATEIVIGTPATSTVTITANDASADSSLSGLGISEGALIPTFASSTTSYTVMVPYIVECITVAPSKNDSGAEVAFLDEGDSVLADADDSEGHQVKLAVGYNVVKVRVTAEDGAMMMTYTVTIIRAKPKVSISASANQVSEGAEVVFTVSRDAPVSDVLDVMVNVDETNMLISDSDEGTKIVAISPDAASTSFAITTDIDDDLWEEHSNIMATITPNSAYTIEFNEGSAQTQIEDDDFPAATALLTLSPNPVAEGETVTATITITTSADQQPHGGGGTLILHAGGGTAQAADYGSFSQNSFEVAAPDFSSVTAEGATRYQAVYTATLMIVDDSDPESEETLEITLVKNSDATHITLSPASTGTVTISANDLSIEATLSALALSEGTLSPTFSSSTTSYTVSVGYGVERVTVTPTVTDSDAAVSIDVTTVGSGSSYPVDLVVGTNTIQVVVTAQDTMTTKTYEVTVFRAKPEVGISPQSGEVVEGTDVGFAVSRNTAVSATLDVTVNVAETGALVPDAHEGSKTVTIPAGATSTVLSVFTDIDDHMWEEHSSVTATIASNDGYTVKVDKSFAEVRVNDDDFPEATAVLSVSPNPVAEGEIVTVTVAVTTSANQQPHRGGGAIILNADDGTAQATDYGSLSQTSFIVASTDFSLDVSDNRYRAEYSATTTIAEDSETEIGEAIEISVSKSGDSASTLILEQPTAVTVDIVENNVGLVALNLSGVTLSPPFSSDIVEYAASVPYSVAELIVTATSTHASSGPPAIKLNGKRHTGSVLPLAVGVSEISIEATSENPPSMRTYTVSVTRQKPDVRVSASVTEATEGEVLGFTVTRSAAAADTLKVIVDISEDGALVPDGSVGKGSRSVIIPIGATSTTLAVSTEADDGVWEAHSSVSVIIGASDFYTIKVGEGSAEALVLDNDFPEAIAVLSVDPRAVVEGDKFTAEVTITTVRDEIPHTDGGLMSVSTANDTAHAGTDYTALTSSAGTVSFDESDFSLLNQSGQGRYRASKHVNITTTVDGDREGVEKFIVILAKVVGGQSPAASQIALDAASQMLTVTIQDGPEAELSALVLSAGTLMPAFATSTSDYTAIVDYGIEQITVTVTKSRDHTRVTFLDSNDNVVTDADGTTPGQQVDLVVGENVIEVRVAAQDDTVLQTYTITLTRSRPEVSISATTTDVIEGGNVVFNVSRNVAASEPLRVAVSVTETDAMVTDALEGEGIRAATIPSYATSTTLTVVSDMDDDAWEAHSTVEATISNNNTYVIKVDEGSAETRVMDNDFPEAKAELAVSPPVVDEGRPVTAVVTVTTLRDEEPHADAGTFQILVVGDTATSSEDFLPLSEDRIILALDEFNESLPVNGETRYRTSKQVTVATVDDGDYEGSETFTIELIPVMDGDSPTASQITFDSNSKLRIVTIKDNDQDQTQNGGSDQDSSSTGDSVQNSAGSSQSGSGGGGSGSRSSNRRPNFTDGAETTRSVAENNPKGTKVGNRILATDRDGERLTYSLSGDDRASFTINKTSGRLYTDVELDRETTARYYVTAIVSDRKGGTDSIEVIIIVEDEDEAPAVTGEGTISHTEEVTGVLATYTANDPEKGSIEWALSGDDAGAFSIDNGTLTFRASPDYEAPADSDGDNVYLVSIEASDGVHTSTLDVSVTVMDLDESPTPTSTPRVTVTPTSIPTPVMTPTALPSATAKPMPTVTPSPSFTPTGVPASILKSTTTPTVTPTRVPTATLTPQPTLTPLPTPTGTPTLVPAAIPTPTATPTHAPMATPTPTEEPTFTREIQSTTPFPTATPASLMSSTEGGSVPAWLMLSITFWAILATGTGVYAYLRHR